MGYQLIQTPSGTNGGGGLLLLIVVGAIVLGRLLGGAELLSPHSDYVTLSWKRKNRRQRCNCGLSSAATPR
jgi:hypothetical protein